MVIFALKIKISGLNKSGRYQHWGKQATMAKKQRTLAAISTSNQIVSGRIIQTGSYIITFTRHGKRILDNDNLIGGLKHVRDGVADALGVNDGSMFIKFEYDQKKSDTYYLEIKIDEVKR